jgi:hypothetical protein
MAVPASRGHRRTRGEDGGQRAGHRALAQLQGEVAAIAEIAQRGDAGPQLGERGAGHRREQLGVVLCDEGADRVRARVEREVDVRVDEPGQQRGGGQLHQLGVRGNGGARPGGHVGDPAVGHEHERVPNQSGAVEQRRRPNRDPPHA